MSPMELFFCSFNTNNLLREKTKWGEGVGARLREREREFQKCLDPK